MAVSRKLAFLISDGIGFNVRFVLTIQLSMCLDYCVLNSVALIFTTILIIIISDIGLSPFPRPRR